MAETTRGRTVAVFAGNIPCEFKQTRMAAEAGSGLRQLNTATGNPISLQKIDSMTREPVAGLIAGKEVGDGQFVQLSEAELDGAFAEREKDIRQVRMEDISDVPVGRIKSSYFLTPKNKSFWGMIGGRMRETKRQMRFHFVEGRQERDAIIRYENDVLVMYVLFFPSECREAKPDKPECKAELKDKVDALFAKLGSVPVEEAENQRDKVIENLVMRKAMGEVIEAKPVSKEDKIEKTAEELLNASL